jgi:hypothetical protein
MRYFGTFVLYSPHPGETPQKRWNVPIPPCFRCSGPFLYVSPETGHLASIVKFRVFLQPYRSYVPFSASLDDLPSSWTLFSDGMWLSFDSH